MVAVGIVMALCNSLGWAQSYYSLQHTNWPPFPFLPFEVTVLDLGDDIFAYDDLSVDYDQLQAARQQALMNVTYRDVETLADHGLGRSVRAASGLAWRHQCDERQAHAQSRGRGARNELGSAKAMSAT